MLSAASVLVLALLSVTAVAALQPQVAPVTGYNKLRSFNQSTLYHIVADDDYDYPPLLIYLKGSRYDIGYSYGYLLSDEIQANYHALLQSLIGAKWYDKVVEGLLADALDWQWRGYLSKELAAVYMTELKGLADGAKARGCAECGQYITRGIVLANAPGDVKDFVYILLREMGHPLVEKWPVVKEKEQRGLGMRCSMFAVWGSRTETGSLYSARNLDWNKDTGVNRYKLAMVTSPDDGAIPSISIGFVGLYGTIAGMSARGITVHEANLEENEITFNGFPWVLRLRYIMEYASNLAEGKSLWESTKNTVGFNHMIASANDATDGGGANVAYVMETMYNYTAYFADNDPRESAATYIPAGSQATDAVHIGYPMTEALWRTNHGYDPVIRTHYEWSQAPSSWSMQRYMFIHDAFVSYQQAGVKIGAQQAINITAIAGDKGAHPYTCTDSTDGSNVVSVTFQPHDSILYAAWERSSGANWRPGTCSTYIKLDMTSWFTN